MDRTFTSTDLFTLAGLMATLVGIVLCLFFLFAPVTFGATPTDALINSSPDLQLSMRWIQPILGQAIVEDTLIKQQFKGEAAEAVKIRSHSPLRISNQTESMQHDHAALVQWVMGRLVVELTKHRMESGLPAGDRPSDESNQRILTIAQRAGQEFDKMFRTDWQGKFEREMVTDPVKRSQTLLRNPDEPGLIF